jgi:hypothetical protein
MTKDQMISVLGGASRWLEGPGSTLSGAVAAKRAIASLFESFTGDAVNTPHNERELVKMIAWEGRLYYDPTAPLKLQSKQLEDTAAAAVAAVLNEEALRR